MNTYIQIKSLKTLFKNLYSLFFSESLYFIQLNNFLILILSFQLFHYSKLFHMNETYFF